MHRSNLYRKTGIIALSLIVSLLLFVMARAQLPGAPTIIASRLTQQYGLLSIAFLLLAMLAGPLYRVFAKAPGREVYYSSLGGLGISAFYFALLHTLVAFFFLYQGFVGLQFLDASDLVSTVLGFIALAILAAMAGTSFSWAMDLLGKRWKAVHRFVYFAALAIVVHTLITGSTYADLSTGISLISIALFIFLVVLEAIATYRLIRKRLPLLSSTLVAGLICGAVIILFYSLYYVHAIVHGGHVHGI